MTPAPLDDALAIWKKAGKIAGCIIAVMAFGAFGEHQGEKNERAKELGIKCTVER